MRVFVPRDAAAVSVGADEVAAALARAAQKAGANVEIVRNGSRGMLWLEPLVEIERDGVRYGFGPIELGRRRRRSIKAGLFEGRPSQSIKQPAVDRRRRRPSAI